jgi:hypothetical protein
VILIGENLTVSNVYSLKVFKTFEEQNASLSNETWFENLRNELS